MLETKQLMVAIEKKKSTMEVDGYRQLFGYQHSSNYLFFLPPLFLPLFTLICDTLIIAIWCTLYYEQYANLYVAIVSL